MNTYTIVYTSVSKGSVSGYSIKKLASQSEQKNAMIGVTGLLLYGSGHYLQVIEGSYLTVRRLYEKITRDNRHFNCKVLLETAIDKRTFPQWNMGLLNLNALTEEESSWHAVRERLVQVGSVQLDVQDKVLCLVREFVEHGRCADPKAA